MPFLIRGKKRSKRPAFNKRAMNPSETRTGEQTSTGRAEDHGIAQDNTAEIDRSSTSATSIVPSESQDTEFESADEEIWIDEPADPVTMATSYLIPTLFTTPPPVRDVLKTESSDEQDETLGVCQPFLTAQSKEFDYYNKHGVPHLLREKHVAFCHKSLSNYPSGFQRADAARPWFFYWALAALSALGEDTSQYRERLTSTVKPLQNETGGFGGGHGQMSHLAATYATVLALAMVGGEDAVAAINRRTMWEWLCKLKRADGGFEMSIGGEVDVRYAADSASFRIRWLTVYRGAYCAAMLVKLLDLPLDLPEDSPAKLAKDDNLFTRLGEYVSTCQTYEGGIGGRPDAEAHGAYAFCALACLSILGDPHVTIPKYLHMESLIQWLSARQYAPEGGLAGRTNKLVDGCYSHWIGGCWPLIEAALEGSSESSQVFGGDSLYSREGLTRYILCCGQDASKRGGLRDKPGM